MNGACFALLIDRTHAVNLRERNTCRMPVATERSDDVKISSTID